MTVVLTIVEAFLDTPERRAERRRRKARARYCRARFGKRSRAYRRALTSLRTL